MIKTKYENISLLVMLRSIIRSKYSKSVIDHFNNPNNIGKLDSKNPNVGTGLVGSPSCGDVLRLQILVKDNKIIDVKFKTFGCGSAIASSNLASEMIKNLSLNDALKITNKDIATYLKLPPIKMHCSMLAESAIKEAIKDVIKKVK